MNMFWRVFGICILLGWAAAISIAGLTHIPSGVDLTKFPEAGPITTLHEFMQLGFISLAMATVVGGIVGAIKELDSRNPVYE